MLAALYLLGIGGTTYVFGACYTLVGMGQVAAHDSVTPFLMPGALIVGGVLQLPLFFVLELLLESREDRTITAFLVSPVPLSLYLFWVSGAMVLTSTALALGEAIVIGHGLPPWPGLVASASVGALAAPSVGLSVSALATSKTEAFAYLKVVGVAALTSKWRGPSRGGQEAPTLGKPAMASATFSAGYS